MCARTPAEELLARAEEVESEAHEIKWTEPRAARHLRAVAHGLRELAMHLPPPERTA